MCVYLATISDSEYFDETKVYKNIGNSLKYIYENLKLISTKYIENCNFFDRDYIQEYFTEEFIKQFNGRINCKSEFGEFFIENINENKYKFFFVCFQSFETYQSKREQNPFCICELEILDLLD